MEVAVRSSWLLHFLHRSLLALVVLFPFVFVGIYFSELVRVLPRINISYGRHAPKHGYLHRRLPFSIGTGNDDCDVFKGRWIRDGSVRPLYKESECPYIQPQLTCQAHGRPDRDYQLWRWQPHDCDLPRFNASLMLETIRGKRMMFVGDSLIRGQYTSLICLLHKHITGNAKSMEHPTSPKVFTAMEYNATIEFYWAPFLLESNTDDRMVHNVSDRIVREGSINKHGKHWKGVDILVIGTYLWWTAGLNVKITRDSLDDPMKNVVKLSAEDAYRMVLQSMVGWIRENMSSSQTRVFFTTMSPVHGESGNWGGEAGRNCYNETTLINDTAHFSSYCKRSMMQIIDEILQSLDFPVIVLNITQLSSYRKDAHASIYKKHWIPPTPEQLSNPVSYADCVHWCLPGVPDMWNELFFTKLLYP